MTTKYTEQENLVLLIERLSVFRNAAIKGVKPETSTAEIESFVNAGLLTKLASGYTLTTAAGLLFVMAKHVNWLSEETLQ